MGGYWRDLPIEIQKEYMGGSFKLEGGKTGMAESAGYVFQRVVFLQAGVP